MNGPLRLTVLGTGYLGITHAACMASLGFEVLGVDTDQQKVRAAECRAPAHLRARAQGALALRLRLRAAGIHHVLPAGRRVRRRALHLCRHPAAARQRPRRPVPGARVRRGACPAAGPAVPGRREIHCARRHRPPPCCGTCGERDAEAELAWNPEFLREGTAVADTLAPDRIVVGVTSPWAEGVLRQVYARQIADGTPFFVTDLETAELAKVAANAFLATKISFINAMAEICEVAGGRWLCPLADPRRRSADRLGVPAPGSRLRRRLSAEGHPRIHGPRR